MADSSLEFDKRVGLVMSVLGVSLASTAEVGVRADGALVTNASDIGHHRIGRAHGSIAADTLVDGAIPEAGWIRKGVIERREAMALVLLLGLWQAIVAVVPVGAVEALVPDASDELESS